jgi:hypothetical protein
LLLLAIAGIGLGAWYSQDPTELPSGTDQGGADQIGGNQVGGMDPFVMRVVPR